MQITASTSVSAAQTAPAATPPASPAASPAAAAPSDAVSLSPAAQNVLTSGEPAKPVTWSSDAVTGALAALNDTSGKTSQSDQLSAFKTLSALIANAENFDPTKAENASAIDVATAFETSAYVEHYRELAAQDAAFTNIVTSDYWGKDLSSLEQRQLDHFNTLSDSDQQLLVQTRAAGCAAGGYTLKPATVDQFKAQQQMGIDVSRAVEALIASPAYAAEIAANKDSLDGSGVDSITATIAVITRKAQADGDTQALDLMNIARGGGSTDYTAKVQAYFDTYGPAPQESDAEKAANAATPLPQSQLKQLSTGQVRSYFQNFSTLADTSNTVSADKLAAAYKNVSGTMVDAINSTIGDPIWQAGANALYDTAGFKKIQSAEQTYERAWIPGGGSEVTRAQSWFTSYEKLDDFDQQLIASLNSGNLPASMGDGSPDSFRAKLVDGISNSAQSDAIKALYEAEQYGHLTAKSTVTILGVTLNLNQIMASNDKRLDPYTRMSADVKALLKDAAQKWANGEKVSIDATKMFSSGEPSDAEKAIATLKAYKDGTSQSEDQKALAALKNGTSGDTAAEAALTLLKNAKPSDGKDDDKDKTKDKAKIDPPENDKTGMAAQTASVDVKA
jgi:hypothetical protein